MAKGDQEKIRFKPFDPDIHDRAAFCSGANQIDNFIKLSARKHQKGNYTRVWVALDADADEKRILGYYGINAHSIKVDDIPKEYAKNAPSHGQLPAAYISFFGVSKEFQGKGLGQILLIDCLKRIARMSDELGIHVVVLDVLEDENTERRINFYEKHNFQSFPSMPLRMFLPIKTINKLLAETQAK